MKKKSVLKKIILKLFSYAIKFRNFLVLCPKKILSPFLALTFKPRKLLKPHRDKPHLLILRNKFYSPESNQISTEVMHLDNTLLSSGFASFEILTYDEDLKNFPFADKQLVQKCQDQHFDAIILSSWNTTSLNHPSLSALNFIRKKLNIPVASIWWDTCSKDFGRFLNKVVSGIDVHIVVDNPSLYFIDVKEEYKRRLLTLWPPEDDHLYHPPKNGIRDIPASFLGQASSYRSYRTEVIDYLKEIGVPGFFRTNDRNSQVSHAEYADIMRRSKISINFSLSVNSHQFKSRILEILLSGTLLMESENEQIKKLFTPMVDYVPFSSKEDLVEKIRYYSQNENLMNEISMNGRNKALNLYSSKIFWKKILEELNLISDCNSSQLQ